MYDFGRFCNIFEDIKSDFRGEVGFLHRNLRFAGKISV